MREQFTPALMLFVLCVLGERLAELLWVRQGLAGFSVAPPLLLAWLLTQPRRSRWAATLGTLAAFWIASTPMQGVAWPAMLLLAVGVPLPSLGLAWWVHREGTLSWPPGDFFNGVRLLLAVGVALPALDVLWMQTWSQAVGIGHPRNELLGLLLTHAAGYLLLVPIAMACARMRVARPATHAWIRDALVALLLAALPLWIWSPWSGVVLPSALMTLTASPLLLWMLVRRGLGGACAALLLCGLAGTAFSLREAGPFVGLPPHAAVLSMQAWIAAVAGALWLVSVALEQQRGTAHRLREAYRQLSDLTGRVLVVQEEERTRIARDLHDDINQSLAALSIRLSYLKRGVEESQRDTVAELQQELLKVSNDIRNMSHGLHPAMLRFTGLESALTAFCQGHGQRSTLRVHCDVSPPDGLGDARELSLFRIVQEALNNVEKHAHAREAWVWLGMQDGSCVLSVSDDGVGLPCARSGTAAGLGLISMGERARLLGGQLTLSTREGGGTHLEVRFPLPPDTP
jgi:two-component system sensor histidine kinase UhpB